MDRQLEKFSKERIEEARKRLDKSSRGSDEEYYTHLLAYAHLLAVNEDLKKEGKKLINALHDEIDTARRNEAHAETLAGIYYWKGYKQALERALTLVLRVEQYLLAAKEE